MAPADWLAAGAQTAGIPLALWAARESMRSARALATARAALRRAAMHHAEAARFAEGRALLARAQATAESAVGGGTAAVRGVHHGIAAIPFAILEAIPATREVTRVVHGIHDLTADSVYGAIAAINRMLGGRIRSGLSVTPAADGSAGGGASPDADAPAEGKTRRPP